MRYHARKSAALDDLKKINSTLYLVEILGKVSLCNLYSVKIRVDRRRAPNIALSKPHRNRELLSTFVHA